MRQPITHSMSIYKKNTQIKKYWRILCAVSIIQRVSTRNLGVVRIFTLIFLTFFRELISLVHRVIMCAVCCTFFFVVVAVDVICALSVVLVSYLLISIVLLWVCVSWWMVWKCQLFAFPIILFSYYFYCSFFHLVRSGERRLPFFFLAATPMKSTLTL